MTNETYSVFTPTTPARLSFIERDTINSRLVDAIRTPGMQVVVFGYSGSGKTTLLINKLHQLYGDHITSRCMAGMTFEQLVLDAFDQLSPFYASERNTSNNTSISAKISQDYSIIKSQINTTFTSTEGNKYTRVLPPLLTPQALARFMGELNTCWVLEDFHKIPECERSKLSQVMKVFMDMADTYRALKIIAIGAVDTARLVVEYDREMKNRVAEILVPLMEKKELEQIMSQGEKLLNIQFGDKLKSNISNFSNGLASVCHQLCLNICTHNAIFETSTETYRINDDIFDQILHMYLEQSVDSVKKVFDTALKQKRSGKFDNARLILSALSQLPQNGASRAEIYAEILKSTPDYPQGNMTTFIERLSNEEEEKILRYDDTSGRYSFREPIYRVSALILFTDKSSIEASNINTDSIKILMKNTDLDFVFKILNFAA